MTRCSVQIAAQYLTAGSGGIARCARLTLLALSQVCHISAALAVEDGEPTQVGQARTRAFAGKRPAFALANTASAMSADVVFYDFAGTARAHRPLALLGKPSAIWAHGWEVWPGNLRADYARTLRRASAVFVNSEHTRRRLAQSLPDLPNVHACWLGTEWDRDPTRSLPPRQGRQRMVLFVGRNDAMFAKGQDTLIEAWPEVVARVPDAVLCFVGGGDRLDRLRSLAATSPASGSIRVLGQLPDAEVATLYGRARLFAMLSNVEGFGLVYAEAMGHGLPILTSTDDASHEVNLEGRTGYSVARGDKPAIVERIVGVLERDALFAELSQNAFRHWSQSLCFSAFSDRFLGAVRDARLMRGPVPGSAAHAADHPAEHQDEGR